MSRDASIFLPWGDQDHTFRLGLAEWRKIQERCDAGPGEIYRRLVGVAMAIEQGLTLKAAAAMGMMGDWRIDDVREVILQGLVGGGASPLQAGALVRDRVDDSRDFKAHLALAYAIVAAALGDVEDEPLGEQTGEGADPPRSPEAS